MILKKMKIKKFIQSMSRNKGIRFSNKDNLMKIGVITSLDLLKVIHFLEDSFSIEIDETDLVIENFETVHKMAYLVKNKAA